MCAGSRPGSQHTGIEHDQLAADRHDGVERHEEENGDDAVVGDRRRDVGADRHADRVATVTPRPFLSANTHRRHT